MNLTNNPRKKRRLLGAIIILISECIIILLLTMTTKIAGTALIINYIFATIVYLLIFSVETDGIYKALALVFLLLFPIISTISLASLLVEVKKQQKNINNPEFASFENSEYFANGESFFIDLIEKMSLAKERIYLEFYIIKNGKIWESIKNTLVKKAENGVDVKLCYDGFGSYRMPKNLKKWLISHKIDCLSFNNLKLFPDLFSGCRSHRKIAIIDDAVYVGGINVGDEYANFSSPHGTWKDCALRLSGDIANIFANDFLRQFKQKSHKIINTPGENKAEVYFDNPFIPSAYESYCISLLYSSDLIEIASPYFIPDHSFLQAMKFALKKGKTVRLYLPGTPDKRFVYFISKCFAEEIASFGAEVYFFKPGFLHSKLFLADSIAIVGSSNVDYRSFYLQRECGVITNSIKVCSAVKNDLNEIRKRSESALFPTLNRRSALKMLSKSILKFIAPLI